MIRILRKFIQNCAQLNKKELTWPRITTLTSLRGVNLDQEYMLPTLESGKRGKHEVIKMKYSLVGYTVCDVCSANKNVFNCDKVSKVKLVPDTSITLVK